MLTSTDEIRAGDINTLDFLRFFRAENTGTTSLVRYAGFWWRALALTIDTVLIVIAFVIVMLVVYFRWLDAPWTAGLNGLIQITLFIVGWLYWTMFESSWMQATPGKKICRLRVTDLSGKRISFGRANGRYFAKTLSAVVYLIGYSVAAVTRRKQAW